MAASYQDLNPVLAAAWSMPLHALPLSCRYVRLGTASLAACGAAGGAFIKPDRLDMRKYASRPNLARVLCDYIMFVVGGLPGSKKVGPSCAEPGVDQGMQYVMCTAVHGCVYWWLPLRTP